MFGFSFFEILFLAALALIVIGPKQLPEVARTIGRFINELRRTTNVMTEQMKQSVWTEPTPPGAPKANLAEQPVIPHVPVSYDEGTQPPHTSGPAAMKKDDSGNV